VSHRKAGSLGWCCALRVILTCVASTASSTASPGALELSVSSYSVAPSTGAVTVTVERAGGSSGIAIANYGTSDGSAVAGTDYTATFDSLTWPDGDTTPRTFIVPIAPGGALSIQVQGHALVSTLDGSTVQIVGINISGLETGMNWRWARFSNAGAAFWSQVLNWGGSGLNTVRLPLNEASWLNYSGYDSGTGASRGLYTAACGGGYTPDPARAYQATVKKAVADATAAGLYVILDLHCGSPNNAAGYPIAITETYGLGAIGGDSSVASQSTGYTSRGWNDWGGQALSAATPPWVDSTAP
jgi:hypothetical protein